jgi:hypothetical protein
MVFPIKKRQMATTTSTTTIIGRAFERTSHTTIYTTI